MCLQSVSQQKEGWRIHIETDGNMIEQQLFFTTEVKLLFLMFKFILYRFCMWQI
jgi:hypothetical protein